MPTTKEIRQQFLDFYQQREHEVVPSASLVPVGDDTLLFTNAGMVPFKNTFLGTEPRGYVRATSSQRCVRAGGKHNDLENVGYTARHHTFFEMLGNFSLGDYFKQEAIRSAWEFLTVVCKIPAEKLWVTVFEDDDEAADIWLKEMGVSADRFSRIGAKDNFWQMGDTGPCGPCTEIFYDHGEHVPGGPPGTPEEDGDRYIEIWNLVFMQFNRQANGELIPLPKPSVDTGMGLERLAAVLQGVHENYEIDLFQSLLKSVQAQTKHAQLMESSHKVIADHIRSCAFLIVDGVLPSNEGRGYVLRRIIRRAVRHGYKLGVREPFFHKLVAALVAEMGDAYPELAKAEAHCERILLQEEKDFARTIDRGMGLLEDSIAALSGKTIPGAVAFKLYDTYGFPLDLTADIARERELEVDEAGFEQAMEEQRQRARKASQFGVDYNKAVNLSAESSFVGYDHLVGQGKVLALLKDGEETQQLQAGDSGVVVLDITPFYAESGGQVGDQGMLRWDGGEFAISDCQKQGSSAIGHIGVATAALAVGDTVGATVDAPRRQAVVLNHSATHLMHAALRQLLGDHVTQKGSLVGPDRLRFDFSHYEPVTSEQLAEIERLVNDEIRANRAAETKVTSFDNAVAEGAMALFGEKYGDEVRMLKFGDFSVELCGGTHAKRTGDIGLFKITQETGVAAGVRRIEAVTGQVAWQWVRDAEQQMAEIAQSVKAGANDVKDKVLQLVERNRQLEKELDKLKQKLATGQGSDLSSQAETVADFKVVSALVDGADVKTLRNALDQLKSKLGSAAIVLAAVEDGKVRLVSGVTRDLVDRVQAGKLINVVAEKVGGRGGGRPDMAQAGGDNPDALPEALKAVKPWLEAQL